MLAVDGGNTKTIAVVADAGGRTLGVGPRRLLGHLQRADARGGDRRDRGRGRATALAARGRARGRTIAAAAFSLAGADWPEDFALLERALRERLGLPRAAARRQRRARRAARGLARLDRRRGRQRAPTTRSARAAPTGASSTSASGPTARAGATSARDGLRAVYHAALGMGPRDGADRARARACTAPPTRSRCCTSSRAAAGWRAADQDRLAPVVLDAADARRRGRAGDRRRQGPHARPRRRAPARRSSGCRWTARGSSSPAACSRTRPSGSPTRRWPSCPAPSPVRHGSRRRSPARCCSPSTGSASPPTPTPPSRRGRSRSRTEGAPDGRHRPRGREQGLPRRRARRRRRRRSRSATASSWCSSGRPAAASRRCCG